jgi:hypothetical protein
MVFDHIVKLVANATKSTKTPWQTDATASTSTHKTHEGDGKEVSLG